MRVPMPSHRGQSGLVGKMVVIWLIFVALLGVAAIDTTSIAFTRFRASHVARNAASAAAITWRDTKSDRKACAAARADVRSADAAAVIPHAGCIVNEQTGEVTITVEKAATTIVAAHLSWTKDFTTAKATETSGPAVR